MHNKCKKCGNQLVKIHEDIDKFTFACQSTNCDYQMTQRKRKPAKFVKECKELSELFDEILREAKKCDSELYIHTALTTSRELLKELSEYNNVK